MKKGFTEAEIIVHEEPDFLMDNAMRLVFDVKKGNKIKVQEINFIGNKNVKKQEIKKIDADETEK